MPQITITIPKNEWWTQNRRGHWRTRHQHTSAVKRRSLLVARQWLYEGHRPPSQWPVHVTAVIHPLTHGRFDPENAAPMVKAIIDAFTQAGIWPDDDGTHIIGPDYRPGEPSDRKGRYRIDIKIEQMFERKQK